MDPDAVDLQTGCPRFRVQQVLCEQIDRWLRSPSSRVHFVLFAALYHPAEHRVCELLIRVDPEPTVEVLFAAALRTIIARGH